MIHYDTLLQNPTDTLIQNAIEVYYKMRQVFYFKMRQFYYKLRRFYHKMRQLFQNATFITNCDSIDTHKNQADNQTRDNNGNLQSVTWDLY